MSTSGPELRSVVLDLPLILKLEWELYVHSGYNDRNDPKPWAESAETL